MTSTLLSRRDMLKGTAAPATAASVGINTTTRLPQHAAQERNALRGARIDGASARRSRPRMYPASWRWRRLDKGLLYEGAFGTRVR